VVVARDTQGAVSWGKDLSEAKRMIAEAIEGIVELKVLTNEEKAGRITVKNHTIPSTIA
jgi:predicted RNase H-like HicB family nuclease